MLAHTRYLSHHSLLHSGYREVEDREKLVTERHRYNLESVDGKIPLSRISSSKSLPASAKGLLVLEGPAGSGKTLLAMQMANNPIESA